MTTPPTEYSPMRPGLFERWLRLWHVLYIGGLLVALSFALWGTRGAWGWAEVALVLIIVALAAGYLRVLVINQRWPLPDTILIAYYAAAIALFAAAVWLNPVFLYAFGMLIGQMFGVLPPRLAVPGVITVLGVIFMASNDWELPAGLMWRDAFYIALTIAGMLLLYYYIYHVFQTSQERAALVNELRTAQAQLEQARAQEIELAALRERERVARDLHDGLGHSLVALSMQLEAVQRLYPVDPARASAQIDDMKRLTRDSMAELRRTLDDLRDPGPDDEPLAETIDRLCAGLAARTSLDVRWSFNGAADLPPAVTEALRRVAREALANVERHAGATRVQLEIAARPGEIVLSVTDNGRGMPADAEALPGHYGLRGMRERVEGLGGELSLIGGPDGSTVRARIPL